MSGESEVEPVAESQGVSVRFPVLLLAMLLIFVGILLMTLSFLGTQNVSGVLFIFPFAFVIVGGNLDPTLFLVVLGLFLIFPVLGFYYFLRRTSQE